MGGNGGVRSGLSRWVLMTGMGDRRFDLVLHGATGYVGRLAAAELVGRSGGLRIALSARNEQRLRAVQDELGGVDWPLLVTDAKDAAAVAALAPQTAVVATTVGPYQRYGLPLVRACAEHGTSYCDLTGETSFVRVSAAAAHRRAVETGARIVHSAGFDSVPSDLGVWMLYEQARADGEGTLGETVAVLASARGGVSGGTIESVRLIVQETSHPARRHQLSDPYALSPDRSADPDGADERDPMLPAWDRLLGGWVAANPFGPHDSRIVRRTNALLGHPYGPRFRYRERLGVGGGPAAPLVAGLLTAGMGALVAGLRVAPTRALLDRVLPGPGQGPSEKTRAEGHFRVEVHTVTSTGARYVATVAADADPGYGATAIMFAETALSLAQDNLSGPGGVLTPAAALGGHLVERLRGRGFILSVRRC
jgi:short subunit dehydrogenase-like uncharacterized protein